MAGHKHSRSLTENKNLSIAIGQSTSGVIDEHFLPRRNLYLNAKCPTKRRKLKPAPSKVKVKEEERDDPRFQKKAQRELSYLRQNDDHETNAAIRAELRQLGFNPSCPELIGHPKTRRACLLNCPCGINYAQVKCLDSAHIVLLLIRCAKCIDQKFGKYAPIHIMMVEYEREVHRHRGVKILATELMHALGDSRNSSGASTTACTI